MLKKLEIKRAELEELIDLLGLNDYRTILVSKELDKIVVKCQLASKFLNE